MEPSSNFLQSLIHSLSFLLPWRWISNIIGEDQHQPRFLFTFFLAFLLVLYFQISRRCRLPPGPRGIPVLGNLPFIRPELHAYFAELGQKYGPIVKLQLGKKLCVVINSASVAREVLKDHDVTFANRDVPLAARASAYGGRDIAWTPYGAEWRMLRKISKLKMLGNAALDSVYEFRRREVRNTVRYLYTQVEVGSAIDVGELGFVTVLNVITAMLWGRATAEGEERKSVGAELREAAAEMLRLLTVPNISDFFPRLAGFDIQGIEKQMNKIVRRFDKIFNRIIDQRILGAADDQKMDFLQFMLEMKHDKLDSETPFTINHLKALIMDMVIGGTDTSSNTIEFAMAEMMKNPQVLKKAQQELDTIVGEENIVEESHIHSLSYLQAIVKETLRLHPALPLLAPHSPSQTTDIYNYTIPKGSRVVINAWAIHRDSCSWEMPLEFKPERFLNSSWDYSGSDLSYIPFGSGRRMCAGIAMAERMVLYFLATLLHSFDWKLKESEKMDVSEKFGTVLKKKTPLVIVPTLRLTHLSLYE